MAIAEYSETLTIRISTEQKRLLESMPNASAFIREAIDEKLERQQKGE